MANKNIEVNMRGHFIPCDQPMPDGAAMLLSSHVNNTNLHVTEDLKKFIMKMYGYKSGDQITIAAIKDLQSILDQLGQQIAGVFKFQGSCTYAELQSKPKVNGHVWQVTDADPEGAVNAEYACNAELVWVKLGFTVDLSIYAKTADVTTAIATAKSEAIADSKAYTDEAVSGVTGGVDFSKLIDKIGVYPEITDLNLMVKTGVYFVTSTANTNLPDGVTEACVSILKNGQLLICGSGTAKGKMFYRNQAGVVQATTYTDAWTTSALMSDLTALKNEIIALIPTVPTKLSELTDDETHRLVTDAEKAAYVAKLNDVTVSGNLLTRTVDTATHSINLEAYKTVGTTDVKFKDLDSSYVRPEGASDDDTIGEFSFENTTEYFKAISAAHYPENSIIFGSIMTSDLPYAVSNAEIVIFCLQGLFTCYYAYLFSQSFTKIAYTNGSDGSEFSWKCLADRDYAVVGGSATYAKDNSWSVLNTGAQHTVWLPGLTNKGYVKVSVTSENVGNNSCVKIFDGVEVTFPDSTKTYTFTEAGTYEFVLNGPFWIVLH